MNIGKIFETEFKNSVPSWCYYYRLRDGTAAYGGNTNMRFQAKNICDCIVIGQAFTYFIELKNTNQKSLPLSNIKENQLKGLYEINHSKIKSYIIICFRKYEKCFALPVDKVYQVAMTDKKSISMQYCIDNGISIAMSKVRVRYKYDLDFLR